MENIEEELLSDEELDFYTLYDEIDNQINNIWYNVILPYIENEGSILNLSKDDFNKFALFFYQNSKYYKFVLNNLD
jgi:hypothetical protein